MKGIILTALNKFLKVTNYGQTDSVLDATDSLSAIPLGTVGDSATGEVAVKVKVVDMAAVDIQIGAVELKDATTSNRAAVTAGGALTTIQVSATETVSASAETADGTVASGAKSAAFIADSDFEGTVAGVTLNAGESVSFASSANNTLSAIDYTCSAGTLRIFKTV